MNFLPARLRTGQVLNININIYHFGDRMPQQTKKIRFLHKAHKLSKHDSPQ